MPRALSVDWQLTPTTRGGGATSHSAMGVMCTGVFGKPQNDFEY